MAELGARLIDAAVATIAANAEELTTLDQAIGDGDHGINMKRGFDAVAETRDEIAALPLPEMLQKAGMTLVMKVGGASGPLYGSFFMAMGKAGAAEACGDVEGFARAFEAGVEAVKKRGKSDAGEKTMLEVLIPVCDQLKRSPDPAWPTPDFFTELRAIADAGLEATRELEATKGRASFLGQRSIGHLDPGARSSQLLVHAVCDVLENLETA